MAGTLTLVTVLAVRAGEHNLSTLTTLYC